MASTRQAIEVPPTALTFERGKTKIHMWRSEYNGEKTVAVAQQGPKTNGYVKMGIPSFDRELSEAFASLAVGHTIKAPRTRSKK